MQTLIQLFLHLDTSLALIVQQYGLWTYMIIFIIIFCETGLVIMPFLPGDSLLFVLGAFSAVGILDLPLVMAIVIIAGIIGDTTNYHIGKIIGPKIFHSDTSRLLHKKHLIQTQEFYETYGSKAIVIARFMPIMRTFAPFVAGIGKMKYTTFLFWNITGAILWAASFILAGYFFGNIPFVQKNLTLIVMIIIIGSLIPPLIEYLRKHKKHV